MEQSSFTLSNATCNNANSLTLAAPIAKCGVLYLGSVVPRSNLVGLESIQEPLSKRYPIDNSNSVHGIDAILVVRENGVEISFVQDPYVSLFYPIESLIYCASVRFATLPIQMNRSSAHWPLTSSSNWGFVPLDSPVAKLPESQHHPPLFCAIFKRTRNVAADECHCFITKTKESAMVLVQACFTSFSRQQRINPKNFHSNCLAGRKVPAYIKATSTASDHIRSNDATTTAQDEQTVNINWYEIESGNIRVIEAPTANSLVDYMTNPNGDGFFYTSSNTVIDSWQLWEERKNVDSMKNSEKVVQKDSQHRSRYSEAYGRLNGRTGNRKSSPIYQQTSRSSLKDGASSFESSTEYYQTVANKYKLPKDLEDDIKRSVNKYSTTIDPYEPAPNLVKVEHKRDPVTGANIFIRWFDTESTENKQKRISNDPDDPRSRSISSNNSEGEKPDVKENHSSHSKIPNNTKIKEPPSPKVNRKKEIVVIKEMSVNANKEHRQESRSLSSHDKRRKRKSPHLKGILRKAASHSINGDSKQQAHKYSPIFDENAYEITEAYFEDNKGKIHRVSKGKYKMPKDSITMNSNKYVKEKSTCSDMGAYGNDFDGSDFAKQSRFPIGAREMNKTYYHRSMNYPPSERNNSYRRHSHRRTHSHQEPLQNAVLPSSSNRYKTKSDKMQSITHSINNNIKYSNYDRAIEPIRRRGRKMFNTSVVGTEAIKALHPSTTQQAHHKQKAYEYPVMQASQLPPVAHTHHLGLPFAGNEQYPTYMGMQQHQPLINANIQTPSSQIIRFHHQPLQHGQLLNGHTNIPYWEPTPYHQAYQVEG